MSSLKSMLLLALCLALILLSGIVITRDIFFQKPQFTASVILFTIPQTSLSCLRWDISDIGTLNGFNLEQPSTLVVRNNSEIILANMIMHACPFGYALEVSDNSLITTDGKSLGSMK